MNEDELIQLAQQFPFPYDYVRHCYSLGFTEKADLEKILQLSFNPAFSPEYIFDIMKTLA